MSKLSSMRRLKLYRNIYRLNEEYNCDLTKIDINDVWLRLISISRGQLDYLLDLILITLILQKHTIKIDGFKLKQLSKYFSKYQIEIGIKIKCDLIAMPYDFLIEFSKINLHYELLNRLYKNKNQVLSSVIDSMFNYHSEINTDSQNNDMNTDQTTIKNNRYVEIQNYFNELPIQQLDTLVLECAKHCIYSTITLQV